MGCCVSRVKDNKNKSFEEEESSENPLNVLKKKINKGGIPDKVDEISKKKKLFEKNEEITNANSNKIIEECNQSGDWNSIIDNDSFEGEKKKKIKYSLNRTHKSLKDTKVNININLKYSNTKYKKRITAKQQKSKNHSRSQSHTNQSISPNISNQIININIVNNNVNDSTNTNNETTSFDFLSNNTSLIVDSKSHVSSQNSLRNSSESPQKDYFSICSHKFYRSRSFGSRCEETETCSCENFGLIRNSYIAFYFEIDYLIIWVNDYLKSLYPELNFVLQVEIDDDIEKIEKIYLIKTIDNFKYVPMLKKEDYNFSNKNYKSLKLIKSNLDIHKISIKLFTFTKGNLILISTEDIYFRLSMENQMNKFKLYKNMFMQHNNKKIANILFNFIYNNEYYNKYDLNIQNSINRFAHVDNLSTLKEETYLELEYNKISNILLPILSETNSNSKIEEKFFSINDIEDAELINRNDNIGVDRLLGYLGKAKKKFDFYEIIKRLNVSLNKKEFNQDKIKLYKETLIARLNKFINIQEENANVTILDNKVIPLILETLKFLFIKGNKFTNNHRDSLKSKKICINEINLNFKEESLILDLTPKTSFESENIHLLVELVNIICKLFKNYQNLHQEIIFSVLYFLSKILEENIKLEGTTLDEYLVNILDEKKIIPYLWEILNNLNNHEGCVLPITSIICKFIKFKKLNDASPNIFKGILDKLQYNSQIVTNVMYILYYLSDNGQHEQISEMVDYKTMKELFTNFNMNNFDLVHESIFHLMKFLFTKKNILFLKPEETENIFTIFTYALALIRSKIAKTDLTKAHKWFPNLMNIIFSILNILHNIQNHKLSISKKLPEILIEVLFSIYDKKLFTEIDNYYNKLEVTLINTKSIIFRTMFYCVNFIKSTKMESQSSPFNRIYVEKLYKVIKNLEDNDKIFHPVTIMKEIEKLQVSNFPAGEISQLRVHQKNLLEYYSRYKSILPEFIKEMVTILKS